MLSRLRGRDADYPTPPAQCPASGFPRRVPRLHSRVKRARLVYSAAQGGFIPPVLPGAGQAQRSRLASDAACLAASVPAADPSLPQSWHKTVRCPKADSDSTPGVCRRWPPCPVALGRDPGRPPALPSPACRATDTVVGHQCVGVKRAPLFLQRFAQPVKVG